MADYEPIMIRYPKGSKVPARLKKEAAATHRSVNAYLLHLIETHPDRAKAKK